MDARRTLASSGFPLLGLAALVAGGGACTQMSEQVRDPAAGFNGGFEATVSGLPANWLVYSPATVPAGDFELAFDRDERKEGEQSLLFVIEACSDEGGWRSPGIAQELAVEPGTTYLASAWIKNEGCEWTASFGGVAAKTGDAVTVGSSLDAGEVGSDGDWRLIQRTYTVPPEYDRARFELGITRPGRLWVDDISIEPVLAPGGQPGD